MDTAVDIRDLSVVIDGKYHVLDDITVSLPAGRVVGIIGPSGAGKTTLIRSLVGRQKISGGSAMVLGQAAGSARLRAQVSYMTQASSVYGDLTVGENLRYFAIMLGGPKRQVTANVRQVLTQVDLEAQAGQLVQSLSGGQRQRVSLGIALLGEPQLLLLDEPTVGLDPVLREQLWKLFRDLSAAGKTIILSSHVMDEAERCDDLVLLRGGRLLAHDSPQRLREHSHSATVDEAFIKLVGGSV